MADDNTVKVTIDGTTVDARPGELLIAAAERNGTYIPRFCWHSRMNPVGMCRQCLVEVDGPRGPALMVSCMTNVSDGMVVHTQSPTVQKAQEGVLEFLLANHPLDCPVCDKGGECPLQDQAFSHGPGESRFVEEKRHYEKPIPISDLVFLDRERCILCDRCTRFAKEVAGDPLIHFTHRGNQTQVLTFPDEPFASYFSGNTVQICPVGALTAKPYRFKARPWDLDQVESTCTTCSVGCRVTVQSSRDELLRYQGVDADPVNWGWLCDKGRFAFESVNSDKRLAGPALRQGDTLVEASWGQALDAAAAAIRKAIDTGGPGSVAVLGGARGTNEDAYAWAKLAKAVIGTDHVDAQLGDGLPAELAFGLPAATIDEICASPTIVLLAPDLKHELPVLYLRIRDVVEKRKARLIELSPTATSFTQTAFRSLRYRPGEQGHLVAALVGTGSVPGMDDADLAAVREQLAKGPVGVVVGRTNLAEHADFTVAAAAALRDGLPQARFLVGLRRGNVRGAMDAGLTPGYLPGRAPLGGLGEAWSKAPTARGLDALGILNAAAAGKVHCLVLLGCDPFSDVPDRDLVKRALAGAASVIAVDTFVTESGAHADVVLAASSFAEKAGTTTNLEGRVSRLTQKVTPRGTTRSDWMIAADLARRLGADLGLESTAQILEELRSLSPLHASVTDDALKAQRDGVVAVAAPATVATATIPVPTVDGYALRLVVGRVLYDAGVAVRTSGSLAGLAPGATLRLSPYDADRLGVSAGAPVRVSTARTGVVLDAVADAAVPKGLAWVAFNQPDVAIADLIDVSQPVTDVRVETL